MRQMFYVINGKEYDNLSEAKENGYTEDLGEVIFKEVNLSDIFNAIQEEEDNGTD